MNVNDIRVGKKSFSNTSRFPYGFKKSGDFSIVEAHILTTYGDTLSALESAELQPINEEEKRFVMVATGQAAATTAIEKAWLKYVRLARTRKAFFTMHSVCVKSQDIDEVDDQDEDDFIDNDLDLAV